MGTFTNTKDSIQGESSVIFLVTGTQEPFDRMLKIVDTWAESQTFYKVVAQTANSTYAAKHVTCYNFLPPQEFTEIFNQADYIVGHAGIGTIIKALELNKKLIIFPRLIEFKEHRNNHQLFTAKSFDKLDYATVAYTEEQLIKVLNHLIDIKIKRTISKTADINLLNSIRDFINE
jgi:UDP-N-acetylglucosamine transferase subunit ALG13